MLILCNGNWCIVSQISNGLWWCAFFATFQANPRISICWGPHSLMSRSRINCLTGWKLRPSATPNSPVFVRSCPIWGHCWLPKLQDSSFQKTSSTYIEVMWPQIDFAEILTPKSRAMKHMQRIGILPEINHPRLHLQWTSLRLQPP